MTTLAKVVLLSGAFALCVSSVPFALLIGFGFGFDLRTEGSGNPGGTNLRRALAKRGYPGWIGWLGTIPDVLKGYLVLLLVRLWVTPQVPPTVIMPVMFGALLTAVVGNRFSPLLRGKGGKGIAVAGGGLMGISFLPGVVIILIWLVVAALSDMISVGSVFSAAMVPVYCYSWYSHSYLAIGMAATAGLLVVWAHRENLRRVRTGTESRASIMAQAAIWLIRAALAIGGAEVYGRENIPSKGPLLIVCNHLRNRDPFLMGSLTGKLVIFLAKKELWQNPLIAYVMYLTRAIETDRDHLHTETIRLADKALAEGHFVGVFPEGHRNKELREVLLPLNPGAGFIASKNEVDVLPTSVNYPYHGWRRWVPRVIFGTVIKNPSRLDPEKREALLASYGVRKDRDLLNAQIKEVLTSLAIANGVKTVA